jgi:hypothetical protein
MIRPDYLPIVTRAPEERSVLDLVGEIKEAYDADRAALDEARQTAAMAAVRRQAVSVEEYLHLTNLYGMGLLGVLGGVATGPSLLPLMLEEGEGADLVRRQLWWAMGLKMSERLQTLPRKKGEGKTSFLYRQWDIVADYLDEMYPRAAPAPRRKDIVLGWSIYRHVFERAYGKRSFVAPEADFHSDLPRFISDCANHHLTIEGAATTVGAYKKCVLPKLPPFTPTWQDNPWSQLFP